MPWEVVKGSGGAYEANADTREVRSAKTGVLIRERTKKCGSRFFRLSMDGRKRDVSFDTIASVGIPGFEGSGREVRRGAVCGKDFVAGKPRDRFCSKKCKKRNDNVEYCGFHVRRARDYGVPYERGITLPLVEERFGGVCQICGRKTDRGSFGSMPTIDHIVPMSQGGGHTWDNVQLACFRCNSAKAAGREVRSV